MDKQRGSDIHTDSVRIIDSNTQLEVAHLQDMTISLLASGDGTQIMHYSMKSGVKWTLLREVSAEEIQFCLVTQGNLAWQTSTNKGILRVGESISLHPVTESVELSALTDTELIFVCSRPMFHLHINGTQEIEHLAVTIEQKDGYTADHCVRIKDWSMKMADVMNLPPDLKFDIKIGSFLHDVGKVRVPNSILNKPGPLTQSEWETMKLHPIHGRDMIDHLSIPCLHGASVVVEQHHERYDGSGYPNGLKGDEIHIGAAIVAVVDSFDAMTSDRIYRKAKPVEEALAELDQCKGILYHPEIVDIFLDLQKP